MAVYSHDMRKQMVYNEAANMGWILSSGAKYLPLFPYSARRHEGGVSTKGYYERRHDWSHHQGSL
ncbi:hypothetical protein KSB_28130 [Ktedonobacter robiniae]|uniref:Uncharacterized protein n=1 Tax=Ktedonobacter robiniae TaxID=2778365 RepID=A0ABQ3UNR1_9CHLR|nr:hypothetical protein KSB_28130 [Ktedonobacter robiniae]